ncbi:hypothetical protein [Botryobacter ruber]|uniref:hypothetical protein n=1 Tax=Botryobacter ruber TaxID=2171629 RepID=UPI0013E3BFF3|nr:hypothetical protein [Botryobacter ruber]
MSKLPGLKQGRAAKKLYKYGHAAGAASGTFRKYTIKLKNKKRLQEPTCKRFC